MEVEGIRKLVASTLPKENRPVYAIDTSTYIRSDAGISPERGIYDHTSRHSAGKPVVAGWSYSCCAQLGETSSWTASVEVSRVPIEIDAHNIAGRQRRAVIAFLPAGIKPLFVFDASDDLTRLAEQIAAAKAAVLVRLRRNRCFYFDPPQPVKQDPVSPPATEPSSFATIPPPGPRPTLNTTRLTKLKAVCAFTPGASCTHGHRIIRAVQSAKPSQ